MRRVGGVQSFGAKLRFPALSDAEIAEEREVQIHDAGSAYRIVSRSSEANRRNGRESERIEKGLARACAAQNGDARLHLVGALIVSRSAQRRAGGGHGERSA